MRSSALITIAAATLAATMFTACSSSSKNNAGVTNTSAGGGSTASSPGGSSSAASAPDASVAAFTKQPTSVGEGTKLTKPVPRGKKFVLISNGAPYDVIFESSVKEATSKLGWQFSILQAKLTDPATTLSAMTTAINSGADFVEVSATPIAIYQSQIPAARAHHTLIISNTGAEEPGSAPPGVFFLQNGIEHFTQAGKVLADTALADAAGKAGNVVTTEIPQLGASQTAFTASAKAELTSKCPDCKVDSLKIPFSDILANKGPSDVVAYLQSHPKTKYVFVGAGSSVAGLPQAIKAAALPPVKVLGVDPLGDTVQDIVKGGVNLAWLLGSFQVYSWEAVDVAARTSIGETPFNWGGNLWLVDKQNADQVDNPANPVFPKDFKAQFERLWGVSS